MNKISTVMNERENGFSPSNSAGSSRRTSNDSLDEKIRNLVESRESNIPELLNR